MKSGFGYFCFICASLLATYSFSQDPSGWSDKTLCRLASSQQDDPQYLQEANNRGLNCGSGVAKKTNNIRKSILSFSEIAAENKRFPKQPKDLCCAGIAVGNFSEKPGLELFAVESPRAYVTYLWGQGKPPHTLSKSYLDAGMKKANDLNWVDKMSFRDGNNKRLSLKIEGNEQFCLHSAAVVPADFNGDGIDDILVACHGYDAKPRPGDHSYVILSQKSKAFKVVRITTKKGFYHGATVFDVNNDGYIDALLTDAQTGKVTVYLNDGNGQFSKPKTVLSNSKSNYTISSYDFNNDGAVDFILGGHEYNGNRNGQTTKIYLGDGNGRFSSNRDYHIPKLRNFPIVVDYLVHGNFLFVARVSGGHDGGAIQQIDLNTMKQVNVLSKTNVRALRKFQRVYNSDDVSPESATFGTLDQYSTGFDFQINADGNINFLRKKTEPEKEAQRKKDIVQREKTEALEFAAFMAERKAKAAAAELAQKAQVFTKVNVPLSNNMSVVGFATQPLFSQKTDEKRHRLSTIVYDQNSKKRHRVDFVISYGEHTTGSGLGWAVDVELFVSKNANVDLFGESWWWLPEDVENDFDYGFILNVLSDTQKISLKSLSEKLPQLYNQFLEGGDVFLKKALSEYNYRR
jgi:hypothetical protein